MRYIIKKSASTTTDTSEKQIKFGGALKIVYTEKFIYAYNIYGNKGKVVRTVKELAPVANKRRV